jgi:hypothetical protein
MGRMKGIWRRTSVRNLFRKRCLLVRSNRIREGWRERSEYPHTSLLAVDVKQKRKEKVKVEFLVLAATLQFGKTRNFNQKHSMESCSFLL